MFRRDKGYEFLSYPVVSGNVSFYNGTNKKNIFPTPVIGGGFNIKNKTPIGIILKRKKLFNIIRKNIRSPSKALSYENFNSRW